MQPSEKGLAFIRSHEGFVSKAYRCPAGVVTIGYGFTMGSRIFASWWRTRHGRALRMGDTISREDADYILSQLVADEYGAAAVAYAGAMPQHRYDACASVLYNLGTGAVRWKWGQSLRDGQIKTAASRLRVTGTTANGRTLPGLQRRRREEADLLEYGTYSIKEAPANENIEPDSLLLASLGYDVADWRAAVRKFQREHDLVVDGIFGRASRAAAVRTLEAKRAKSAVSSGGVSGGVIAAGGDAVDAWSALNALTVVGGCLAAALVLWLLWRNRGRIFPSLARG